MAQSQIIQTGAFDLVRRDGVVDGICLQLTVEHHQIQGLRVGDAEVFQQRRHFPCGESRAVDIAVQTLQMNPLDGRFGKNMDILAPVLRQIG